MSVCSFETPAQAPELYPTQASARVLQRCGATPCPADGCRHEEDGEQARVSRSATSTKAVPRSLQMVDEVVATSGRPLDGETRSLMEHRFGHDFSGVRVYSDGAAGDSAAAVRASAYTLGRHIVFGQGEYQPASHRGRRLLAHELTHVIQQGHAGKGATATRSRTFVDISGAADETGLRPTPRVSRGDEPSEREADSVANTIVDDSSVAPVVRRRDGGGGVIHRQPIRSAPQPQSAPQRPARRTAASFSRLDFLPARASPCACIVFIHNNERNARAVAEALHNNCSYNLAIRSPGGDREIRFPTSSTGRIDPNELFGGRHKREGPAPRGAPPPLNVAEDCSASPEACERERDATAGATDAETIARHIRLQYFLAIRDCSNNFTLPVVGLHNNRINDTAAYRRRLASRGVVAPRVADVDKSVTGSLDAMKTSLRTWFGSGGAARERALTETPGTTNIYRWCNQPDIARCHVGDSSRPDDVVWTTNPADFARLSAKPVNVVLQTASGPESESDLSTLFLRLGDVGRRARTTLVRVANDMQVDATELDAAIRALMELRDLPESTTRALRALLSLLVNALRALALQRQVSLRDLRFVNIETPINTQSAAERVDAFHAVRDTLRELGLLCCPDPATHARGETMPMDVPTDPS